MEKLLKIAIPVCAIALFVLIMNSSFLFQEPGGYQVPSHVQSIEDHVLRSDWTAAGSELGQLDAVIKEKIFPFIQFSVEKDEMIQINLNIARVRGCIETQNIGLAVLYLQEIECHWNNLNR